MKYLLAPLILSHLAGARSEDVRQRPLFPTDEHSFSENTIDVFSLRHIFHHGTHLNPDLHKHFDISDSRSTLWINSELDPEIGPKIEITRPLIASSSPVDIERLQDRRPSVLEPLITAAQEGVNVWESASNQWALDTISGPNVTDKDTILTFAYMGANAYEPELNKGDWKDVGGGFNETEGFGWEKEGVRGYVYANEDESTVVISFKGGSARFWNPWDTAWQDKENVNMLFGCCCGQGSFLYHRACNCAKGSTCDISCVGSCLRKEEKYYAAAQQIYSNITALYPDSQIWLTGHSLGGTMSSLLGLTYGLPAITFETPGDALPVSRLGLPAPPGSGTPQSRNNTGTFHFGVTSDPIFTGTCTGWTATCALAGYSFESTCHTGRKCVYDVMKDFGWHSSILSHGITSVIYDVLLRYETVPECKAVPDCTDCSSWKEVSRNRTTTSMPSSSSTSTSTATCRTPGWFGGCWDKTTSATAIPTS
ncbi:related to starvation induced protein PSI-7 [Phialocephala subalpina]|uniref:triacylglycerol lipase n=1 Tax=Phialocephala subalpina TaxID=576137 RepID=A0A1L7WFE1_9HELO|nr:related to starvation induced protein PSI-7 [Phialocephala subalpina]